MRTLTLLITLAGLAAAPASAQRLNLDFPGMAERAVESVEVTLDAQMLAMAARFFASGHSADERAVRDIVRGLEGIYVRSFQFDRDDAYDRRVVDSVRRQLGPTWKKVVNVTRRRENLEVYTDVRGEAIAGLVVIAAEARELTIVNIVGPIDMARLARLQGNFGVPRVEIEVKEKR